MELSGVTEDHFHARKDVAALKGSCGHVLPSSISNFHARKDVAALKGAHRRHAEHRSLDFHARKDVAALKADLVGVALLEVGPFPRPKGRGRIEGISPRSCGWATWAHFHARKDVAALKARCPARAAAVNADFHARKDVAALKGQEAARGEHV